MKSFSQRIGKSPIKSVIQTDSIDEDLKNALWNGLTVFYWDKVKNPSVKHNDKDIVVLLTRIWTMFFKFKLDEMPANFRKLRSLIKNYFFTCEWYGVYDFLEFVTKNYGLDKDESTNHIFRAHCNDALKRELSAYRFLNGMLVPISSKEEVESLEEALNITDNFNSVKTHLKRALELFADRKTPDYRNSIKESISAVESYCSILTGDSKASLGKALNKIERDKKIHPALKNSFSSLYGYTSDADGIRHALLDEENLHQEDAKFMLVTCSAFINYLKQKEAKSNN